VGLELAERYGKEYTTRSVFAADIIGPMRADVLQTLACAFEDAHLPHPADRASNRKTSSSVVRRKYRHMEKANLVFTPAGCNVYRSKRPLHFLSSQERMSAFSYEIQVSSAPANGAAWCGGCGAINIKPLRG
jgi:hypothetical protein